MEHENKQDIATYVRDRLCVSRELKASEIPNLITDRAKGVFMWAHLSHSATQLSQSIIWVEQSSEYVLDFPIDCIA